MTPLDRTNYLCRAILVGLAVIAATVVVLLAARPAPSVADPTNPPGGDHGHAGEHGRHKGKPFQSPSVPQ